MRIAIEASWAMGQPSGVGYYLIYLLQSLAELDKENEYYLLHYHAEWIGPDFGENFTPVSYRQGPATFSILFNLNRVLRELNVDLYHATAGTGVSHFKPPCPVISTVYDLFRFKKEDKSAYLQKKLFCWQFKANLKHSDYFIAISHNTKEELCRLKGVKPELVEVTHLAACVPPHEKTALDKREHFICLGGLEKRKEQYFLLQAYAEALKKKPDLAKLYFVGSDRGELEKMKDFITAHQLQAQVEITGYVSDEYKEELLSKAKICFMPSSLEGFGLPLLEAQAYGIPVIASDIDIFREIAGESALLVPLEQRKWSQAIIDLDSKPQELSDYIDKGYENHSKYTWEKCAQSTLSIYNKLAKLN